MCPAGRLGSLLWHAGFRRPLAQELCHDVSLEGARGPPPRRWLKSVPPVGYVSKPRRGSAPGYLLGGGGGGGGGGLLK